MNAASLVEFQEYIKKRQKSLPQDRQWVPTKEKAFKNGWKISEYQREDSIEFRLFDPNGEIKHQWLNLNPQVPETEIISHSKGTDYLIYHIDLYGISVFNLTSLQKYDFYPERSFPFDKKEFKESFIWTNTFYSEKTNLIVFFGCFWACPYTGMIADFTDPMTMNDNLWFDLQNFVDSSKDNFLIEDVNGWIDDRLELTIENQENGEMKKISYSIEELKDFISKQSK